MSRLYAVADDIRAARNIFMRCARVYLTGEDYTYTRMIGGCVEIRQILPFTYGYHVIVNGNSPLWIKRLLEHKFYTYVPDGSDKNAYQKNGKHEAESYYIGRIFDKLAEVRSDQLELPF